MSEVSISILNWVDLVQIPLTIAVILVLFLKRRVWFALFGVFMATTGVLLHLPLFRAAGSELGDWWWWTWRAQGFAVFAVLVGIAWLPPISGSWWDRQRPRGDNGEAGRRFDRSTAGGILSIVLAGFATIALTIPVAAVIFTNSEIDLAETWSLPSLECYRHHRMDCRTPSPKQGTPLKAQRITTYLAREPCAGSPDF